MNIFVYSDESGVFDVKHNEIYVFAGVVYLSKEDRDIASRKYIAAENTIYQKENIDKDSELKASLISNSSKSKLYRALNNTYKFAVVIHQSKVHPEIFSHKKAKQRFLDFVYKIGVKRLFENLIAKGVISADEVKSLYFFVDEHTTATNGRYELREALEQEFKHGTYTDNYTAYFPPIFKKLSRVELEYCNSKTKTLVRAADIVANKIYHKATNGDLQSDEHLVVTYFPL